MRSLNKVQFIFISFPPQILLLEMLHYHKLEFRLHMRF